MPRCRDLPILVLTTDGQMINDRQTNCFTPCTCTQGSNNYSAASSIMHAIYCALTSKIASSTCVHKWHYTLLFTCNCNRPHACANS